MFLLLFVCLFVCLFGWLVGWLVVVVAVVVPGQIFLTRNIKKALYLATFLCL